MKFRNKMIVWSLLAIQMIAWFYFQFKGGELGDAAFYIFCVSMLLGQGATCAEALIGEKKNWGTFTSQTLFFLSTIGGGIQRYLG